MRKIIIPLILILVMCCGVSTITYAAEGVLNNFSKEKHYTGQFSDVMEDSWFFQYVKTAYEYNLVNGTSRNAFSPDAEITIAQTITLAARIHSIYYGENKEFEQSSPWYLCYVQYAEEKGIIDNTQIVNYSIPATRAQFAVIISRALPKEALTPINQINNLPDVSLNDDFGESVLRLYCAGVLTGSDRYGTFHPESYIKRSEIAAIIARVVDLSLRQEIEIQKSEHTENQLSRITGYTVERKDYSVYGGKHDLLMYFDTVVFEGEGEQIKKINDRILEIRNRYEQSDTFKNNLKFTKDFQDMGVGDYEYYLEPYILENVYYDDQFVSVKWESIWFVGGVSNKFYPTFSVVIDTLETITLKDLLGENAYEIVKQAVKEKIHAENELNLSEESVMKASVSFDSDNVYVSFGPYEFWEYGWPWALEVQIER